MKPPHTITCCGHEIFRDRTNNTVTIGGIKTRLRRTAVCLCPKCNKEYELKVDSNRPHRQKRMELKG